MTRMTTEMYYAVAYDIADDRRRRWVSKTLEDFGRRIQFSLFVCQTNRRQFLLLHYKLQQHIDKKEDTIVFLHLCRPCQQKIEYLGVEKNVDTYDYIV